MVPCDPGKPKLKSILLQNLDWLEEIDKNTQVRGIIHNTIQKISSCEKSVLIKLYALKFFIYEKSFMSSEYPITWMHYLCQDQTMLP